MHLVITQDFYKAHEVIKASLGTAKIFEIKDFKNYEQLEQLIAGQVHFFGAKEFIVIDSNDVFNSSKESVNLINKLSRKIDYLKANLFLLVTNKNIKKDDLDKNITLSKSSLINKRNLEKYVNQFQESNNFSNRLSNEIVSWISENCLLDSSNLNTELYKFQYLNSNLNINEAKNFFFVSLEKKSFDLLENYLNKNTSYLIDFIRQIDEVEDEWFSVFNTFSTQLVQLKQVKLLVDKGLDAKQISSDLNLQLFQILKYIKLSKFVTLKKLNWMCRFLFDLEKNIILSSKSLSIIFKSFLIYKI